MQLAVLPGCSVNVIVPACVHAAMLISVAGQPLPYLRQTLQDLISFDFAK
jgi:hypothetical protein